MRLSANPTSSDITHFDNTEEMPANNNSNNNNDDRASLIAPWIYTHVIPTDWRMKLNNVLQANKALGKVAYETSAAAGTQHQGPWTAVATSKSSGLVHARAEDLPAERGHQFKGSNTVGARATAKALRRKLRLVTLTKNSSGGSVDIEVRRGYCELMGS